MSGRMTYFMLIAIVGGILLMGVSYPSEARWTCYYEARDPNTGRKWADGRARARKKWRACKRARRRCNREHNRKNRRRPGPGRGVVCKWIYNVNW